MLDELKKLVKEAGQKTLEFYGTEFNEEKEQEFPVTKADLASDKILTRGLKQFEEYGLLSEEQVDNKEYLKYNKLFIIDPLDGTKDFVHKTNDFAVMLALVENEYPILGIIYQPITDKMYYAQKGKGAFLEEKGKIKKIEVSKEKDFSKMKLLVSRFHLGEQEKNLKDSLGVGEFKQAGSAGLKICQVAEGSAHIYVSTTDKTGEWDSAAGAIIVEEAGGVIIDLNGDKLKFKKENPRNENGFIVSNGVDHQKIIKAIKFVK